MSRLSDGGQKVPTVPALESSGYSYLVRTIKPNPIASHDWHVQPICQRSLRLVRLSGPFGSRPRPLRQGVLELVALADFCLLQHPPAFLREPSKLIELSPSCQARPIFAPRPLKLDVGGRFLGCDLRPAGKGAIPFRNVAQRKISKSDQQNAPEPMGLAGAELPGLAMACSLWDSLQGFRGACLT
jgi:hypothetical protein